MFVCVCVRARAHVHAYRAEGETKTKLEKINEIHKLNTVNMMIKSDISKYEETLQQYKSYKKFLDRLTPPVSTGDMANTERRVERADT